MELGRHKIGIRDAMIPSVQSERCPYKRKVFGTGKFRISRHKEYKEAKQSFKAKNDNCIKLYKYCRDREYRWWIERGQIIKL